MRRTWIKLYVDQCLRGSMIAELTAEQRWQFLGLLLLAGDSSIPGVIYKRKDADGALVGYSPLTIADMLDVEPNTYDDGIRRMVEKSKITIDANGVISIVNWTKYQSEYERTRHAPSRDVQKYGVDVDVDRDVDRERDKKKNICYDVASRRWHGIEAVDMESWATAYPACDINTELAKAGEWILANPTKGKKSNYRRFIVNWLSRAQDRGGSAPSRRVEAKASRIGASPKRDHDDTYWAEVRRKKAEAGS
jgi:hypothetical protein